MTSSFNLPAGLTTRDLESDNADAPIVCDGCGYAKQSTKFIACHDAELCAGCDRQWTARAERDHKQLTLITPGWENSDIAALTR